MTRSRERLKKNAGSKDQVRKLEKLTTSNCHFLALVLWPEPHPKHPDLPWYRFRHQSMHISPPPFQSQSEIREDFPVSWSTSAYLFSFPVGIPQRKRVRVTLSCLHTKGKKQKCVLGQSVLLQAWVIAKLQVKLFYYVISTSRAWKEINLFLAMTWITLSWSTRYLKEGVIL